jgi:hypothetical protein
MSVARIGRSHIWYYQPYAVAGWGSGAAAPQVAGPVEVGVQAEGQPAACTRSQTGRGTELCAHRRGQ